MHRVCSTDCGGTMVKHSDTDDHIKYICDKCGRTVIQGKRKPNLEIRRIYLHRHEWEMIAQAVDRLAESTLMTDMELFKKSLALKDKILEECKPKIRPKKKFKRKRKKLHKAVKRIEDIYGSLL